MEYRVKRTSNNEELFHSDSFLGVEFSDELYHWKYERKEKLPSGKVRYYYKKTPAEKFKFGYEYGSKEDPNTGRSLNTSAPNPALYRKLANTTQEYAELTNDSNERSRAVREAMEWETKAHMAKSFMTKLGYFTGRTINDVEYNVKKGKNRIKELIGKLK